MDNQGLQLKEVLYITPEERAINYKWEKEANKLSPRVQIISEKDLQTLSNDGQLTIPRDVYIGDVLLKHPYETNAYIQAEKAVHIIRNAKLNKIGEIAQCLGAKSYKIIGAWNEVENRTLDVNGNIGYIVVKSKTEIHKENEIKELIEMSLSGQIDGARIISEESFHEAEEIAKQYGLWEDEGIKSLIRSRNPNKEYPIINKEYSFNITKEENDCLEAAFSLNVMKGIFDLKASVKSAISRKESLRLSFVFDFPDK